MCGFCGCGQSEVSHHHDAHDHHHHQDEQRIIQIEQDILAENQGFADQNREWLKQHRILAFNFVSSPGSGKTTLLVETIKALQTTVPMSVIEGDQQTDLDRQRIAATGIPVIQITTGKTCHLDAHHISHAVQDLKPKTNSILFIENVGNLVCPALFDLGEKNKIVILSVTEGDDKPLKYPYMFEQSALMIINKIDLLPYVNFNIDHCIAMAMRINPAIEVIQTSATTREGLSHWQDWLLTHYHGVQRQHDLNHD